MGIYGIYGDCEHLCGPGRSTGSNTPPVDVDRRPAWSNRPEPHLAACVQSNDRDDRRGGHCVDQAVSAATAGFAPSSR